MHGHTFSSDLNPNTATTESKNTANLTSSPATALRVTHHNNQNQNLMATP